jgi:hypothetical protein
VSMLCSDLANAIARSEVERDEVETETIIAPPERCHDMLRTSQQSPRDDDNDDSTSKFSMVHCSALQAAIIVVVPSNGVVDHTSKRDGGDRGTYHCNIPSTSSKAILNDELVVTP